MIYRTQNDWTKEEDDIFLDTLITYAETGATTLECLIQVSSKLSRAVSSVRRRFSNHLINELDESVIKLLERNDVTNDRETGIVGEIEKVHNELGELIDSVAVIKRENEFLKEYRKRYHDLDHSYKELKKKYTKLEKEHEDLKNKLKGILS